MGLPAKYHLIFLLLVPIILILIFLLPQDLKDDYFILRKDGHPISFLLSSYTHSKLDHLLGNLLWYLLAMFLILRLETDTRRFRLLMTCYFLLLPPVVSLLSPPKHHGLQGFSDVVSGLMGYFPHCILSTLDSWGIKPNPMFFLSSVFILNSSLVFLPRNPTVAVFLLLSSFSFFLTIRREIREIFMRLLKKVRSPPARVLYGIFLFSSSLSLLLCLPTLLPARVTSDGGLINVTSHLLGYLFGLILPIVLPSKRCSN